MVQSHQYSCRLKFFVKGASFQEMEEAVTKQQAKVAAHMKMAAKLYKAGAIGPYIPLTNIVTTLPTLLLPKDKICQLKLLLLGESVVGKSSLALRFVKGNFPDYYQESSIEVNIMTQTICVKFTTVKFEICEIAGPKGYHILAPMSYRGAKAAIVVYDITNRDTFGRAKFFVKPLQHQAPPNITIALAGNKADLAAKRAVTFEEAHGYAEENGLLFMETSAKTAMNINDIFLAIAKKL